MEDAVMEGCVTVKEYLWSTDGYRLGQPTGWVGSTDASGWVWFYAQKVEWV